MSATDLFGLVVCVAVLLYLLYARYKRRAFHLPGGDGMAVTVGGFWCVFLLIWRLFDRPGIEKGSVGVQWGLFVTMVVAAVLALILSLCGIRCSFRRRRTVSGRLSPGPGIAAVSSNAMNAIARA